MAGKQKADRSSVGPMDHKQLGDWLWEAACSIRGPVDAPKFKDYILPLVFLKRLSDVFDDEVARLTKKFGDPGVTSALVEKDHGLVRFYLPDKARWESISQLKKGLGQGITDALREIAKVNPPLQGVVDMRDFNARVSGQRIIEDERLEKLVRVLSRNRLGLQDVEPDLIGRAYEYLLRKFAEGQGQSGGEFFTPTEVGWLIARLLKPTKGLRAYDPACGSGGLLIKAELVGRESSKLNQSTLDLYGQEMNPDTFAIARMNMIVHDMAGEIAIGDTILNPKFTEGSRVTSFDLVAANPMWNQDSYESKIYKNDAYERFTFGYPPDGTADWAWVQHLFASMSEAGRAVIVLDSGAASRGSGGKLASKERAIRKQFVDKDLIEGVILLPENLFFNAGGTGVLICLNRKKPKMKKEKLILIDASAEFEKGSPKNLIPEHSVSKIAKTFHDGKDVEGFARVVSTSEVADTDYSLSPLRYVAAGDDIFFSEPEEAAALLMAAENDRELALAEVTDLLKRLGLASDT